MPSPTHAEILAEPAGPRLDSWVLRYIFKRQRVCLSDGRFREVELDWAGLIDDVDISDSERSPSTDIVAAMEVWEKLLSKYTNVVIQGRYVVLVRDASFHKEPWATAGTMPLALARAALLTTLESDVSQTNPKDT